MDWFPYDRDLRHERVKDLKDFSFFSSYVINRKYAIGFCNLFVLDAMLKELRNYKRKLFLCPPQK